MATTEHADASTDLPPAVIDRALDLVAAVREYDPEAVAKVCARPDLAHIAVALAAMVEIDRPLSELFAWNDSVVIEPRRRDGLRPCGTHAAFVRHRANGTPPCAACTDGERLYQAARGRRRRAEMAAA